MEKLKKNIGSIPLKISKRKNEDFYQIWLRKNIEVIIIMNKEYWSFNEAYGEYSLEEGQYILALAEIDFDKAFEIVASWEKEKSLPE